MKKLKIDLEHCYGIRKLKHEFDLSKNRVYAIYAPNGSMKSSLANTFKDVADGVPSRDRVFPDRTCRRTIVDENGTDLPAESVLVIRPYDEVFGHNEKTSTLLVDSKLRREYEELYSEIDRAKDVFLSAVRQQSGSKKKNLEAEISSTFTKSGDEFYRALERVESELRAQKDAPFADVDYDVIFDDKVVEFLGTKDFKSAIEDYVTRHNELLDASLYFKKGVFNYYNASTIAKNLADNGFFDAKHIVQLRADKSIEITSRKQLEELVAKEIEGITNDKDLRKKYADLKKLIEKNVQLRNFQAYISDHPEILPKLANVDAFREDVWKSYFKQHFELYDNLLTEHRNAAKRRAEIEGEAAKQRTHWEAVIEIFNERFFVPFTLSAKNKLKVMLGVDTMLTLDFTFKDSGATADIKRDELMAVLSTGERKALYILNVLFEVEVRKQEKRPTVFVVDDIADSFDYRNKYAILQYLKDIAGEPYFNQIILTHNFDFFRTAESRFVPYDHCLVASKTKAGLVLKQAIGIRNIFVKDWKANFFSDPKKMIASIPFMRNLIEYTKGEEDPDFVALTSLLHWRSDSKTITEADLHAIYGRLFSTTAPGASSTTRAVLDVIQEQAEHCLAADDSMNFENKIVLSIATRLLAEHFMVERLADPAFVATIDRHQTGKLLARLKKASDGDPHTIHVLERVVLMTPENIHLNSFMYEPILDMSDEHLRKLYEDVRGLVDPKRKAKPLAARGPAHPTASH